MARKKQASTKQPSAKQQPSSGNSEGLEALAARGRLRRENAKRGERRARAEERESGERRRERQIRSTLRKESVAFILIVSAAVLGPVAVIWGGYSWLDPARATWLMLGTLALTALLVFLSLRSLGDRSLAAEQARLAALPFAVTGFFEAIGAEPRGSCTMIFELRFRGEAIERSTARDIGGVVDAELEEVDGRVARFTSADLDCSVNDGDDTNGPVLHFMRRVLEQVALPLHEESPLEKVSFRRQ